MRIGELLVKSGIITEDQLKKALEIQKTHKKKLGEILIELGYINARDLVWILSEQVAIPFIELKPEVLDSQLIKSFPEKLLYDYCAIPLYEIEGKLYIAMGDPTDKQGLEKIKEFVKKEVILSAAEPEKILELLDKFFLTEQTEQIFINESFKGTIKIDIDKEHATMEVIDENGTTMKFKGRVQIMIKFQEQKDNG